MNMYMYGMSNDRRRKKAWLASPLEVTHSNSNVM